MFSAIHERAVHTRRVRRLSDSIAELLEAGSSVVDVGAGDGALAFLLGQEVADGLYPWPASWLFESGLHFVARLRPGIE